ncbi:glycosyl transferase family 90 [Mesorhizobium sp. KR9-304]|uniref:glycosyl transferase family 90 n=1 Tax=Mesorhizobium sp. KR9-304 TaxID=3156614 RepID=UPI0032B4685F
MAAMPIRVEITARKKFSLAHVRPKNEELYCSVRKGKLRIIYHRPWKIRHIQVASLLANAIALLGARQLPPFCVNIADKPSDKITRSMTRFAACAVDGFADVAAPDFVFEGWPEASFENYDAKIAEIVAASDAVPRHDRAIWLGRVMARARSALMAASARDPDAIEAIGTDVTYDPSSHMYRSHMMTMEEQVRLYRYLIDVEGYGYSGRLKMLLHSGRVVLVQDRPYRDFFFDGIEPYRHYVPVARDCSDLAERIEWLRANPSRAAEIAAEARRFAAARLTRKAAIESWAALLERHAAAGGNLRSGNEHLPRPVLWSPAT